MKAAFAISSEFGGGGRVSEFSNGCSSLACEEVSSSWSLMTTVHLDFGLCGTRKPRGAIFVLFMACSSCHESWFSFLFCLALRDVLQVQLPSPRNPGSGSGFNLAPSQKKGTQDLHIRLRRRQSDGGLVWIMVESATLILISTMTIYQHVPAESILCIFCTSFSAFWYLLCIRQRNQQSPRTSSFGPRGARDLSLVGLIESYGCHLVLGSSSNFLLYLPQPLGHVTRPVLDCQQSPETVFFLEGCADAYRNGKRLAWHRLNQRLNGLEARLWGGGPTRIWRTFP